MRTKSTTEAAAKPYRYPGPDSFRDDAADSRIFFGRDDETTELLNRLLANKLLVLYAKSGLGKTSLLQAGLFPKLRERDFLPLRLRFNHRDTDLLTELQRAVQKACQEQQIAYTAGEGDSYWEFFNSALFSKGERFLTPVLILDQFEEIFTLQDEAYRNKLGQQLGDLVSGQIPDSVRESIRAGGKLAYPATSPNVRLLISLREDSVGALQDLAAFVPGILAQRFRLTPLPRERARHAIVDPALLDDENYASRPFAYQAEGNGLPDAADAILDHLQDKRGNIEPFQLQLLCRHVELKVIKIQSRSNDPVTVDIASYLGGKAGMDAVIKRFYQNALAALPNWLVRFRARGLCENGLLNAEGRRESLSLSQIRRQHKLKEKTLKQLVEQKVLRREERLDSFAYELSHDSLAAAVFKSRRSALKRKWLVMCLLFAGIALWQWRQTVNEGQRADLNLAEYRQQVQALVALDSPEKRTIKEPRMVRLPPGRFTMGSKTGDADETPVHNVAVKGFAIAAYEVTFEEYDQFAAAQGYSLPNDKGWGRGKQPVINVSWQEASAYAAWLSAKTGKHYRLPSEAEWEYAARAGTTGDHYWGASDPKDYAWFTDNSSNQTHPVGQKQANAFGLYDTAGNVLEWVQDCWHNNYQNGPADGTAWERQDNGDCSWRVLRGGSWYSVTRYLRSASRFRYYPDDRGIKVGFRLAQD